MKYVQIFLPSKEIYYLSFDLLQLWVKYSHFHIRKPRGIRRIPLYFFWTAIALRCFLELDITKHIAEDCVDPKEIIFYTEKLPKGWPKESVANYIA